MNGIEQRQLINVRNNLKNKIRDLNEQYEKERERPESQWCQRYLSVTMFTKQTLEEQVVLITEIIDNNVNK